MNHQTELFERQSLNDEIHSLTNEESNPKWADGNLHLNFKPSAECLKLIDLIRKAQELHIIHMNVQQAENLIPSHDQILKQIDTLADQIRKMTEPAIEEVRQYVAEILEKR